jgi:PIN domain nuclease of toxin-antitoxin system
VGIHLPTSARRRRAFVGRILILPITIVYAEQQASLPKHHGDPFDRMLVAQSRVENISVVSVDAIFEQYGVNRIW